MSILTISLVALCLIAQSDAKAQEVPEPANRFGNVLLDALELDATGSGYVEPLRAYLKAFPDPEAREHLEVLVNALNQGYAPDSLAEETYGQLQLGAWPLGQKLEELGTGEQRLQVARLLWTEAQRLHEEHPERAALFARGAVLLAAADDLNLGPSVAAPILRTETFSGISGLAQDDVTQLVNWIDQDGTRLGQAFMAQLKPMVGELDALIQADAGVGADAARRFARHLRQEDQSVRSWALGNWMLADLSWRLVSLAHAHGDNEAIEIVEEALDALKQTVPPVYSSWYEKAKAPGPKPEASGWRFLDELPEQ